MALRSLPVSVQNDPRVLNTLIELGVVDLSDIVCAFCGCSQQEGCSPRCWWVVLDLENGAGQCSTCAGISEVL